ncbi:DinB family protein [Halobacillus salinarum]|uniref:DinB family protein n=1 Tax=Halobacillus salinarum TaxID=2932257 RepID=A0ABY4EJY7_9BACI|nr:DinB family protein [Halobacillus salinarum]UOQ44416.1 DinB family protein [Halobacillus salinarum]
MSQPLFYNLIIQNQHVKGLADACLLFLRHPLSALRKKENLKESRRTTISPFRSELKMMDVIKQQYELVKMTRELFFRYCETLKNEDYCKELEGFGWGSIRNLHVHVAECYESWLGRFAFKEENVLINSREASDVKEVRELFQQVDQLAARFLEEFGREYNRKLKGRVSWQGEDEELTVLWLITHTMTHEFHHKGQAVSMGRKLGYLPPDTDLIPPEEYEKLL